MASYSFSDPSGSIGSERKRKAQKRIEQAVSSKDLAKFPYCSVVFGDGGSFHYRCFSSAQKKIGQQGPAGAGRV